MKGHWLWRLVCLIVLWAAGCDSASCSGSKAIAELTATNGEVTRDFADRLQEWLPAKVGERFQLGDGLRTAKTSTAEVRLDDGSSLGLESESILRFLEVLPGSDDHRLVLEMGQAVLVTEKAPVRLQVQAGIAVIQPGSKLRLKKTERGTSYEVMVGQARLEPKGAAAETFGPGSSFVVSIGGVIVERSPEGAREPAQTVPPPSAAPEPAAPADDEKGDISMDVTGAGAMSRAAGQEKWTPAHAGHSTVTAGSSLRLTRGTRAVVQRGRQRAEVAGAGEFVLGAPDGAFVQARQGNVTVRGHESTVRVSVPGGTIATHSGAIADVGLLGQKGTRVDVKAGRVSVTSKVADETLLGGEQAMLLPSGVVNVTTGRGPGYFDLAVGAGESIIVHDPSPPLAVGVSIGKSCPSAAVVQLLGRAGVQSSSRGEGVVNILVSGGTHRYEVRCLGDEGISDKPISRGQLTVIRDAGTAALPRSAPQTLVETDGRRYTVLYQNLLPTISAVWPSAPSSSGYALEVASPRGKKNVTTAGPRHTFAAGALPEGQHRLTFQAASGVRSKTTTVDIRFDNAAPKASLRSPANGSFGQGAAVTVSGVALPGWSVTVGGRELPTDPQHRFSGSVAAPPNQRSLVVRFAHPQRGVHHYIRRSSGSP